MARNLFWILLLAVLRPCPSMGQTFTSDKGTGVVTLQYVYFDGGDHLYSTDSIDGQSTRGYTAEGNRWYLGDTTAHTLLLYWDYGILDRLGISGTIAWVSSKYVGRAPVNREIDDGTFHPTWQDFGVDVRYMIFTHPLFVTAAGGIGAPLTHYPNVGHTAVGRDLKEVRGGLYFARDVIVNLPIYGGVVYGVSEELGGINLERLTANLGAGYVFHRGWYAEVFGVYQNALNGIDWVSDNPSTPTIHGSVEGGGYNGALAAARFVNIAGSVSVDTPLQTNLAFTMSSTVWGENIEDGIYTGVALSWRFGHPEDEWNKDW